MWRFDPCLISPTCRNRSSPTNTPVFPPSSFILPSFVWFYILFFTGQVLLSTLSWCSACTSASEGDHGLCIFIAYLIGWRLVVFLPCCSCSLVNCGGRCIRTLPWNWLDQLKPSSALNYKGTPTDICLPWRGIPKTWKLRFLVAMTIFCNVSKKCFALHTSKHEILISKSAQRL